MNRTSKLTKKRLPFWKLAILLAMINVTSQSFGQSGNEVAFYLLGSFSKLDYEVLQQKSEMENGFGIGAAYAYYLSENWSIATGAGVQYMEGSVRFSNTEGAYFSRDLEGEDFEFRYRAEGVSENQKAYFLNIPLLIQYETRGHHRFYAAGGIKAGIPLSSEFESHIQSLVTSGYYPQYEVELNNPEFAGFGEFGPIKKHGSKLDLKTDFILHLESGVKFMLENNKAFYMGLFLDFGLRNIQPEATSEMFIPYNQQAPAEFSTASVLASRTDTSSEPFAEELRTLAFGLKIQYAFQF